MQNKRLCSFLRGYSIRLAGPCVRFFLRGDVLVDGRTRSPVRPWHSRSSRAEVQGFGGLCSAASPCRALTQPVRQQLRARIAGLAAWASHPLGIELPAYKLAASHQGSTPFCYELCEKSGKVEQEGKDGFFP